MANERKSQHGEWSSPLIFMLAAAGSAVGLGNIWKFPFITGEYGGGAFVLVYLGCILLVGIPIMVAEISLGRRARQSPINALEILAKDEQRSPHWKKLGWMGVVAGFLILSFYSVVAGWAVAYMVKAAEGFFTSTDPKLIAQEFHNFLADPWQLLLWHTVFMVLCFFIVVRGVQMGLEKAVTVMMPLLFVILLVLVGYGVVNGAFAKAVHFMFRPDFHKLTREGILVAMGHSFFTLSLGMGAIMAYGSYLPSRASIGFATLVIAGADTLVALLAGLAIFPIVFQHGLAPGAGPGLLFQTVPISFGDMPAGNFFGFLFFLLVVFAALTSGISLLEPSVAYLVENNKWSRFKATGLLSLAIWVLGVASVLSFNVWSDVHPLGFIPAFDKKTIFDLLDGLTTNVLLPTGGLFIAVFAGWKMRKAAIHEELSMGDHPGFSIWYFVVRYISPVAVAVVLLNSLGLLKLLGITG